eukprot:UN1272
MLREGTKGEECFLNASCCSKTRCKPGLAFTSASSRACTTAHSGPGSSFASCRSRMTWIARAALGCSASLQRPDKSSSCSWKPNHNPASKRRRTSLVTALSSNRVNGKSVSCRSCAATFPQIGSSLLKNSWTTSSSRKCASKSQGKIALRSPVSSNSLTWNRPVAPLYRKTSACLPLSKGKSSWLMILSDSQGP